MKSVWVVSMKKETVTAVSVPVSVSLVSFSLFYPTALRCDSVSRLPNRNTPSRQVS